MNGLALQELAQNRHSIIRMIEHVPHQNAVVLSHSSHELQQVVRTIAMYSTEDFRPSSPSKQQKKHNHHPNKVQGYHCRNYKRGTTEDKTEPHWKKERSTGSSMQKTLFKRTLEPGSRLQRDSPQWLVPIIQQNGNTNISSTHPIHPL